MNNDTIVNNSSIDFPLEDPRKLIYCLNIFFCYKKFKIEIWKFEIFFCKQKVASNMPTRPISSKFTNDDDIKTSDTIFFFLRYGLIVPSVPKKISGNNHFAVSLNLIDNCRNCIVYFWYFKVIVSPKTLSKCIRGIAVFKRKAALA